MHKKKKLNYNVYLTGFMGVGKTTVSGALAREYRLTCLDLDKEIEKAEKMKISEIFAEHGEAYFRQKETEMLEALSRRKGIVVSCGGGTALYETNRRIMKRGKTVLLTAPDDIILKRLRRNHNRPLIEGKSDEEILELMRARNAAYMEAADIVIETSNEDPRLTAERIVEQLV